MSDQHADYVRLCRWWNGLPDALQIALTVVGSVVAFTAPVWIIWLACTVGAR